VVLPEEFSAKLLRAAADHNYDLIFFDHRSGLSNAILPIISACPGPVAICLRLDEQSSAAASFFDILLRQNVDYPGLFISFSLDPEDTLEKMHNRGLSQIDNLLTRLSTEPSFCSVVWTAFKCASVEESIGQSFLCRM
jgi:hypothetical protein